MKNGLRLQSRVQTDHPPPSMPSPRRHRQLLRPRPLVNYLAVAVLVLSTDGICAFHPTSVSSFTNVITDFLDAESIDWRYLDFDWKTNANLDVSNRVVVFSPPSASANARPSTGLHIIPSPKSLEDALPPNLTRSMTTLCSSSTESTTTTSIAESLPEKIIHLHQDVWMQKTDIVKARLLARTGRIKTRVFARKTICRRIDKPTAFDFLERNHLWGGIRGKYNYGLFALEHDGDNEVEVLVAVASFGPRRRVSRPCTGACADGGDIVDSNNTRVHSKRSSFELLRFSSRVDGQVIGGLGKLIKTFTKMHEPDDVVTVVDRDWGTASGWRQLGFHTVAIMPSLVMAIGRDGIRRHLVGAGIQPTNDKEDSNISVASAQDNNAKQREACKGFRPGLSHHALNQLAGIDDYQRALRCLASCGVFPVYDVGVERLVFFVDDDDVSDSEAMARWEGSTPRYAECYYSSVSGIQVLLDHSKETARA